MANGKLFYDERQSSFYILAQGYMTAQFCPSLKNRLLLLFDTPSAPECVEIDLSSCTFMDSTFLGLVASIGRRLKEKIDSLVRICGANAECKELFRTLGMEHLVEYADGISLPDPDWKELPVTVQPDADLLIRAHDELSDISDENRKKFALLLDLLKKKN
jgi:anti-anti-sigma regulatory factor